MIAASRAGSILKPNGDKGADFLRTATDSAPGPVHFALSVDRTIGKIQAITGREGWQCYVCSRGGDFDVVEVWVENRFLVELPPPEFAARYLDFASLFTAPEKAAALMASHERQAA
jgi:hypothetical protein